MGECRQLASSQCEEGARYLCCVCSNVTVSVSSRSAGKKGLHASYRKHTQLTLVQPIAHTYTRQTHAHTHAPVEPGKVPRQEIEGAALAPLIVPLCVLMCVYVFVVCACVGVCVLLCAQLPVLEAGCKLQTAGLICNHSCTL